MYPYIHIPVLFTIHLFGRSLPVGGDIGTFGIMLWFAAVCAGWVLHLNFRRWKIDADAIGIVAVSTVAGVVGAKLWHVLEDPQAADSESAGAALRPGGIRLVWRPRRRHSRADVAGAQLGIGRLACSISRRPPRLWATAWDGWAA